jgi:hypothetical protein
MAAGDIFSEDDEPQVVVAGMVAQGREGLSHVAACSLGHHPFGLFDHEAAVEGVLELLVDDLGLDVFRPSG